MPGSSHSELWGSDGSGVGFGRGGGMKEKVWDEADAAHYDDPAPSQSQLAAIRITVDVLAELAGDGSALEFAIGTGRIGLPLAARGVRVVGLENSPAMADRLREKDPGVRVPVTIGDMATERVAGSFQLVYLVFNTIGNLTTPGSAGGLLRQRRGSPSTRWLISHREHRSPTCDGCPQARMPASSPMPRVTSASTDTPIWWLNRPCRITSSPAATQRARARPPGASCGHQSSISWRG